jgi:hypothetical protein
MQGGIGDTMRLLPVLVILALVADACSTQNATTAPPPATPPPSQQTPTPPVQNSTVPVLPSVQNQAQNPETVKLLDNIAKVKSYSFDVAFLPDARARYHYDVRGGKAKVTPSEVMTVAGRPVDVIYLDFAAQSAAGYCTKPGICADTKIGVPMSFAEYNITLPTEWVGMLTYGEKDGTLTFYDAPVTVVKGRRGNQYYEAYVQNFYGMPMRVAFSADPEMTSITGGYEYRNMAFNTIRESDVTPPQ